MELIWDSLLDALIDGAKLLPFLFAAFLLLEGLEHHSRSWIEKLFAKGHKLGPLWGSLMGLVPQCGFSVMGANMYAGGVISLGTLMAILLSTSDEAVIIMLGSGSAAIGQILPLLLSKLVIGLFWGFLIDLIVGHVPHPHHHEPHDLCENCGCDRYPGIVRPALYHTVRLFVFILIFNFVINTAIGLIGEENLSSVLLGGSAMQPLLTSAIGLIPNCAASILITELYISGSISFGSAVAGLAAGAGVGLAVLFRMHGCLKKNLQILALLYVLAAVSGFVIDLF
ncbi:MAG: arsenic efflux protein [Lachnospiraceae bacterium]|nr:arsenic efflux protein [Lachnospiraceae bacterium]